MMSAAAKADMEAQYRANYQRVYKHTERLGQLEDIIKVCAFACETRRVLNGIEDALGALEDIPRVKETMKIFVTARSEWMCMDDETGVTLQQVAKEMREIRDALDVSLLPIDSKLTPG